MTFPSGGSVFDEELQWVKRYFEKWSHCERAIAVCSMLKQFQHPTLRFIQSKIEATYAQSTDCDKNKWMEQKSNDKSYISELCDSYKSLTNTTSDVQLNNNNKDSIYFESDRLIIGDNNSTTNSTNSTTPTATTTIITTTTQAPTQTTTTTTTNLINSSTINNNNNNNNNINNNNSKNNKNNNNNNNNNNYSNNNANSTSIKVNLVADKFSTKEEILTEILNCILMLKIGNDDVIQEYLALIPFMVDDTHRRIINVEVVMQTLSILVAHPALSSEDLRTVKEHIERLKCIIQVQNGQFLNTDWQAIAPPMYAYHYKTPSNNIFSSLSSVGSSQIQNENVYDTQSDYIETDSGSAGRSSGGGSDFFIPNISLSCKQCHSNTTDDPYGFLNASDDQNISFSKNGTEIHDFNPDQDQTTSQFIKNLTLNPLIDSIGLKTRRSNSLTTGGIKHNDQFLGAIFTSSTENLAHLHKPRSYSLSIENPRLLMTASGSETRLDDLKPTYQAFQTQNSGMKYVGAWLKRLRLHKYAYIFENFTFEQMMDVTDDFLEKLTVTQGARTKLVNSIQKLKERYVRLTQAEQELKNGQMTTDTAIQLLIELVETPMKPIDIYDTTDVAAQFLNLLNIVCQIMNSKQIGPQDEEAVNQMIQIFDIAQLRNTEPFLSHANQLKDLRFDIDLIKMKFPPKNHYHKSGNGSTNGSSNKSRWSSSSKLHNKNGTENKPHRKNSNPMSNFNFVSMQQVQKQQKPQHLSSKSKQTQQRPSRQSEFNNNYHPTPTSSYNKSSSYPNFSSNSTNSSNGSGPQYVNVNNQNTNPQLHHSYHRHSVSNLITITPAKTTVTITPTAPITQHQKTSSCIGLHLSSQSTPHSSLSTNSSGNSATTSITSSSILTPMSYCSHQCSSEMTTPLTSIGRSSSTGGGSYHKQSSSKNLLGDISPYRDLEFLSLQMTEQAIN